MEAKLFLQHRGLSSIQIHKKLTNKPKCYPIFVAVLTNPAGSFTGVKVTEAATPASAYNDTWFDKTAINYLSQSVQATTGMHNNKIGYDSLVEAATVVSRNFNPSKQREVVIQALERAFPRSILSLIRSLLPQSKFTREYFAIFTTFFFAWLVGPCEVKESEMEGRKEKNVVYVKKCRFLEESNCVGMCINLCKMPSQVFIKDSLGMPVNMVPNFDDMSCEMIFGQDPPEPADDPAFKQPCYKTLCKAKQKHSMDCSSK